MGKLKANKTAVILLILSILLSGTIFNKLALALDLDELPPSLKTVTIPGPADINDYIADKDAAVRLGKALFWDMQIGSDGIQACATCHYHAGADNRSKNQFNPGQAGGDNTFQYGGPNYQLVSSDFPFHKLADTENRQSRILQDYNDVIGSQGVFLTDFVDINSGSGFDFGTGVDDLIFNVNDVTIRRTTGRNAPTVINAVFNFANFWDGRANNIFNGENPFGASDPNAGIWVNSNGSLGKLILRLVDSSLASQAVGPPMSDVEMSWAGRDFHKLGKKMLALTPLAKQLVHPNDSVLGPISAAQVDPNDKGLITNYSDMIKSAFHTQFWNSDKIITFDSNSAGTVNDDPGRALTTEEFTQMEANFAFLFGLAIQMYESTLVSDDTPFDQFVEGDANALTAQQQEGLDIFLDQGRCIRCHDGAEFTGATINGLRGQNEPIRELDFVAILTGADEVPAVNTVATGTLGLTLIESREKIDFILEADDIFNVQAAHIHLGAQDVNGPAIFSLFDVNDGPFNSPVSGILTEADFIPAGSLQSFDDAVAALKAGNTYVNVHTTAYPDGEIRGQDIQLAEIEAPIEFMIMATGSAFYDNGFYNIGVRPTAEDIGRGGNDQFDLPLAFSSLGLLKRDDLLPLDVAQFVPDLPVIEFLHSDRVAADGAFKTPTLRNIELTGPYFHNGTYATLMQVVEFYTRGGDFREQNIDNLDLFINNISHLEGHPERKQALVAFLKSLTDERVRWQKAPFDHPQLFVPNGSIGDHTGVVGDCNSFNVLGFADCEEFFEVNAVGADGLAAEGLLPLSPFLGSSIIEITPEFKDFGDIAPGESSVAQLFTVTNISDTNLHIGTIIITGDNASEFTLQNADANEAIIVSDANTTFEVIFSPDTLGPKIAQVEIPFNEPNNTTPMIVSVVGGGEPDISLSQSSHNFGNITAADLPVGRTFIISNNGLQGLEIGTIGITGSDASQFQIIIDNSSNQTIIPDGTAIIIVGFNPTTTGTKTAELSIPSNDPDESILKITLTGSAAVAEVIIDNNDVGASSTGLWEVSAGIDPYGADSLYSLAADDTFTFSADLFNTSYVVYMWWTTTSNRNTDVPVEIRSGNTLLDTIFVNQQMNGSKWVFLGIYTFEDKATVTITSQIDGSTNADAVKFAPDVLSTQIIIDNSRPQNSSTGSWSVSGGADPYSDDSVYSNSAGATFTFEAAISGYQTVSMWWTGWPSRSGAVEVQIFDSNTLLDTVTVDQTTNASQWNDLGIFGFSGTARVTIIATGNNTSTSADAVSFIRTGPPEVDHIEIEGPTIVVDNRSTDFDVRAFFVGGSSQPVEPQVWDVNSLTTTISNTGLLTVGDVNGDIGVVITAIYTVNDVNYTDTHAVTIEDGGVAVEVIVDNLDDDAIATGTWLTSGGANPFSIDSVYGRTTGDMFEFEAELVSGTQYAVYMWWTTWPSRLTDVPVQIHSGTTLLDSITVNQQLNGSEWVLLGIYSFDDTTRVTITAQDGGSTNADAVKFTPVSELTEIIIDNGTPLTSSTGIWSVSGGPNPYGTDSQWSRDTGAVYTYTTPITAGNFDVYAWWTEWPSRLTNVPYEISDSNGVLDTVSVNQQINGGQWNFLGTYNFSDFATVEITSQATDTGSTNADAIRFVPEN